MYVVFFDSTTRDYDAGTPFEEPLGGSQSALSYLTTALAARGHRVETYTGTSRPREFRGVKCCSYASIPRGAHGQYEAFISCNGPADISLKLRPLLPRGCRLILWTGHAPAQPAMLDLGRAEIRDGWDLIVCVSNWHAAEMQRQFGIDPKRIAVIRNATAPMFENLFSDAESMMNKKSSGLELVYTSIPPRGLEVLLSIFPRLRRYDPRIGLRVFSSLRLYGIADANDGNTQLYEQCRSMPGVEYVGSVSQPALAEALKSSLVLAYPNTVPETSCIVVMEAMAAGLLVVTSDLGGLPETTMGMGVLVKPARDGEEYAAFGERYTEQLIAALEQIRRDPRQFWEQRWEQVQAMMAQHTWSIRAAEWERVLQERGKD